MTGVEIPSVVTNIDAYAFGNCSALKTVKIPNGKYTVVCRDGVVTAQGLGITYDPVTMVPPMSALIMYSEERTQNVEQ